MANKNTFKHIKIEANSRLHMGFISLNSSLPFSYGGVGISISGQPTIVTIKKSKKFQSNLPKNITNRILNFLRSKKLHTMIKIDCMHCPENHIGLGSGTQLILSVEELIAEFYKLDISPNIFNRKFRSGIGMNSYTKGGFIVDAPKK